MEKFGVFVIFGVNLRFFHSQQSNYLLIKIDWTTNLFLVDPLHISNPQSPSEIWKKDPKILDNKKS